MGSLEYRIPENISLGGILLSINDEISKIMQQEKPIYEMGDILQDIITGEIGTVVGILQAYGATSVCMN